MTWKKRISFALFLVLLITAGFLGYGWWMSRRVPRWYRPRMSREQIDVAANKATKKLSAVINFADPTNPSASEASTTGATTGPGARSITFTQDELNAFLLRWSEKDREAYEKYVTEPQFALKEGQIIFSGHLVQLGKFCSLFIDPSIDENTGDLRLDVSSIQAGMLPIPEAMVSKQVDKLTHTLEDWLPAWQSSAEMDQRGADKAAMKAAMSELLLHTLRHEPAAPLLFIGRFGEPRSVPVKLTDVTVKEGTLSLSIERMDVTERAEALKRLKQPVAANKSAEK